MLQRNRPPVVADLPTPSAKTFERLDDHAVAVVAWLNANRVDYVVVGPVARIIRGDVSQTGALAIVPAPYGRNLDRLARGLAAVRARVRLSTELGVAGSAPVKLTPARLVGNERWQLRLGVHELDVEGRPAGVPRYQELLYEAARFPLADGVEAEIAAPEDIEHYDHLRRTGSAPEIRVTRAVPVEGV